MTPSGPHSRSQSSLFGAKPAAAGEPGWITAHTDGGSRGNPGPAGYGVLVAGEDGATLAELSEYLGHRTNNFAEYSGLLAALQFALDQGHPRLRAVSDSELMVKQIQGRYRVNSPELRPLYEEARRRIARLEGFRIEHVLREKNRKADALANRAMDKGMGRAPAPEAGDPARAEAPKAAVQNAAAARGEKKSMLRGFVKNGVVHLLGGELPDNTFVKIVPE